MKPNKWLIVMVVLLSICYQNMWAQDRMPLPTVSPPLMKRFPSLPECEGVNDTIAVKVRFPSLFTGISRNEIADSLGVLLPLLERLRLAKAGVLEDTVRIVHIGDSHIRGFVYPHTTGEKLADAFGVISYTHIGINGATCLTFIHPSRIAAIVALEPELVVLSFGTNESHDRRYNANIHYQQMNELVTLLRDSLPNVLILLTTPPGSYDSFRQRRRKRTYAVNPRTVAAVQTIHRFSADHKLPVWDMYNVVGGSKYACRNWVRAGLLRSDRVHYTSAGYALQGELLYEAIIKAYNEYVSH